MQVETAPAVSNFRPTAPSQSPPPVSLSSYSFPAVKREDSAERSRSPSEFSSSGSPYPGPPLQHFSYDLASGPDRSTLGEGFQPRTMSMAGLPGFDTFRGGPGAEGAPMQYSAIGRQVVGGGPVQRVVAGFSFSEYLSDPAANEEQQHLAGQHAWARPLPSLVYGQHQPGPPPSHYPSHHPSHHYPHPAHHYQQQHQHQQQWSESPPPCCSGDEHEHAHHDSRSCSQHGTPVSTPAPRIVYAAEGGRHGHHPYAYSPYGAPHLMVRSISGHSSSSSAYSDSEANRSYSSSQNSGSEYDNGVCNPAYINPAHNVSTLSVPDTPLASFYGSNRPYAGGKAASTSDLHTMNGLRLDESGHYSAGEGAPVSARQQRATERDSTIRGSPGGSTTKARATPSRTAARAIFHPSPASMLAPTSSPSLSRKAGARVPAPFPGTNSPGLPSDAEFARMPTKRSRGRRPPCSPDLVLSGDPNANPSEAQIRCAFLSFFSGRDEADGVVGARLRSHQDGQAEEDLPLQGPWVRQVLQEE